MMSVSSQQKQNGLTLIELLIAMLLGTLMILGATSMFTANKRIYKEVDYQGRLAENARFAMEMIIRDLRMTGYIGCAIQQDVNNDLDVRSGTDPDPTKLLSFMARTDATNETNSIEGSESGGAWQPTGSTDANEGGTAVLTANTSVADFGVMMPVTMRTTSDGFTVRFLEDTNTNLCASMTDRSDALNVQAQTAGAVAGNLFLGGNVYAAADCEATNIFQLDADQAGVGDPPTFSLAHATGSSPGNITGLMSKQYTVSDPTNCAASPVDIMIFRARRYFVGEDQDGSPGLYRQIFDSNPNNTNTFEEFAERLIDGVENMQILYGEDSTAPFNRVADTYVNAATVTNWENVVSVKLALLFATVDEDFTTPLDTRADYQLLNAAPFDPTPLAGTDDHRRRKIVEATVSLRNRQLSLD